MSSTKLRSQQFYESASSSTNIHAAHPPATWRTRDQAKAYFVLGETYVEELRREGPGDWRGGGEGPGGRIYRARWGVWE